MTPPAPFRSSLVVLISALFVAALLLPPGEPPSERPEESLAAAPDTPPTAGWAERDVLLHYAEVICLRAAYGALEPAPSQVLEALDAEGWSMVELSHQKRETYRAIHKQAWTAGDGQAPAGALAGCDAWVKGATDDILRRATRAD